MARKKKAKSVKLRVREYRNRQKNEFLLLYMSLFVEITTILRLTKPRANAALTAKQIKELEKQRLIKKIPLSAPFMVPSCLQEILKLGSHHFRSTSKVYEFFDHLFYNKAKDHTISNNYVKYGIGIRSDLRSTIVKALESYGAIQILDTVEKRPKRKPNVVNWVISYSIIPEAWNLVEIKLPRTLAEAKRHLKAELLLKSAKSIDTFEPKMIWRGKDERPKLYIDTDMDMIRRPDGTYLRNLSRRNGNRIYNAFVCLQREEYKEGRKEFKKEDRFKYTFYGQYLHEVDCSTSNFTNIVRALATGKFDIDNIGEIYKVRRVFSEAKEEALKLYKYMVVPNDGNAKGRLCKLLNIKATKGKSAIKQLKDMFKYCINRHEPGSEYINDEGKKVTAKPIHDSNWDKLRMLCPKVVLAIDTMNEWLWKHSDHTTISPYIEYLEACWFAYMKANYDGPIFRVHDAAYGTDKEALERAMENYLMEPMTGVTAKTDNLVMTV